MLFVLLIFLFIIGPLSIICHELGHAMGAYIVKTDVIDISIGKGQQLYAKKLGRLQISIHKLFFAGGFIGHERENDYKWSELLIITVLGPIMNLLIAVICFFIDLDIFRIAFYFNIWLFIFNLLPMKIGGRESDGYICLELLKKRDNLHI